MRELYFGLNLDVTGEGQKAARKLAREDVLRGVPVQIMEVRVTLDGAELELCQECRAPVHYYDPDCAPRIAKPMARGFDHIGLIPFGRGSTGIRTSMHRGPLPRPGAGGSSAVCAFSLRPNTRAAAYPPASYHQSRHHGRPGAAFKAV